MSAASTGLIVAGFVLLLLGIVLRVILMMQASDATPRQAPVLYGRQLLLQYRRLFPHSRGLRLTQSVLLGGTVLLVAGIAVEMTR